MDANLPSPTEAPRNSYPATTKQAAGHIDGILTDVTCTSFSDKILITITQAGRLAQWVTLLTDLSRLLPSKTLTARDIDPCTSRRLEPHRTRPISTLDYYGR